MNSGLPGVVNFNADPSGNRFAAPEAEKAPRAFGWVDLAVLGALAAFIYAMVTVAHEWRGALQPVPAIHLEAHYLPLYALYSLSRGVMAYGVSFLFTMVYGYTMARVGTLRGTVPLQRHARERTFYGVQQPIVSA